MNLVIYGRGGSMIQYILKTVNYSILHNINYSANLFYFKSEI